MLWDDLEPGDKLMFNPEWVKNCSQRYLWWEKDYNNKIFTISVTEIIALDRGILDIYFLEIVVGFGIFKDTGFFCNKSNSITEPPLFKIVELKDD